MGSRSFHLHDGKKGAALAVRVTPRASKNEIVDILSDGTVKVHLTAPPVEGKANAALLKFLAKVLDVPLRQLEVVAGTGGRDKLISVIDMDANTLHKKIVDHIG
ncbi:MAG TPA: DUF167 domain-containing protein [Anaerolineales bacterium]|jgi:uncharacterized protein (TIGR00251 family)